jgi:hypothetical protein
MPYQIAICITTFLRDNLLFKNVQTYIDNYTENTILLIADQGYHSKEKDEFYAYVKSQIPCEVYYLPFDSGLSYGRNYLVQKAKDMNIEFCIISADSLQMLAKYDYTTIIDFLKSDKSYGLVGFEDAGGKCCWEFNLDVQPEGIHLSLSDKHLTYGTLSLKQVDICGNIFLAKTDAILNLWDNEMKLAEHELAFIELKKREFKVFFTDTIKFKRVTTGNTKEYEQYRNRWKDYIALLKDKLDIDTWVIYDKGVMEEIRKWKKERNIR